MDARDRDGVTQVAMVCAAVWASTGSSAWAAETAADGWDRVDTLTLVLACITVLLTVLAIGIGGLAIWGFQHFREIARVTAEEVAKPIAERIAREVAEPVAGRVAEGMAKQGSSQGDYGTAAAEGNGTDGGS